MGIGPVNSIRIRAVFKYYISVSSGAYYFDVIIFIIGIQNVINIIIHSALYSDISIAGDHWQSPGILYPYNMRSVRRRIYLYSIFSVKSNSIAQSVRQMKLMIVIKCVDRDRIKCQWIGTGTISGKRSVCLYDLRTPVVSASRSIGF